MTDNVAKLMCEEIKFTVEYWIKLINDKTLPRKWDEEAAKIKLLRMYDILNGSCT